MDKNIIENIEDLPLVANDKWYVLLVYLGLKSGSWLILNSSPWREGEKQKKVSKSDIYTVKNTLSKAGICYKIQYRNTDAGLCQSENNRLRYNQLVDIFIAKDKLTLKDIVDFQKTKDDKTLGVALGYPETAVDAFGTDQRISKSDLLLKTKYSEAVQLTYFILSKNNWLEELKVVQSWIDATKKYSPTIYGNLDFIGQEKIDEILDVFKK